MICINLETSLREIYVVSYLEGGIGLSRGIRIKMGRREGKKKYVLEWYPVLPPPPLSRKANAEG